MGFNWISNTGLSLFNGLQVVNNNAQECTLNDSWGLF